MSSGGADGALDAAAPTATTAVRAAPAVDAAPPVTPNLVRRRPVPGARDVGRNIVETLVFRGLSTPLALGLVVLQSRFLHPSGRGAYVLAVLSVTLFSRLLGQLGVAVSNRLPHEGADLRGLLARGLALAVLLGAGGAAAIVAWGAVTHDVGLCLAALAAAALIPNLLWQTVSGVLLGLARVRLWNWVQLLPPLLTLVGMLVLVVGLGGGVRAAVLAWTLANAITALFALAATRELWLPRAFPRLADASGRMILGLALAMGAVQVANLLSYRVELLILRRYDTLADVGVYSIAVQTAESLWLIAGAVATAVTAPALHDTEARAVRLVARAAGRALGLTALAGVAAGAAAPFIVPSALGEGFREASPALALLLPGAIAYAPVAVLVVYLSVRRGRPRLSLIVALVGLVVTTSSALALIPPFGVRGAAAASTIGYLVAAALAWGLFVRLARQG